MAHSVSRPQKRNPDRYPTENPEEIGFVLHILAV
jgi:hypothetical protein